MPASQPERRRSTVKLIFKSTPDTASSVRPAAPTAGASAKSTSAIGKSSKASASANVTAKAAQSSAGTTTKHTNPATQTVSRPVSAPPSASTSLKSERVPVQVQSCSSPRQAQDSTSRQRDVSASNCQNSPQSAASDSSDSSEQLTFTQMLSITCDILGPECRGFMWVARPLLWLGALACVGFAIGAVLQFLHIIWWADGSNAAPALLSWLAYTSIPAVLGIALTVVALPRDDGVHCWRLIISLILIAAGVLYGLLQGWISSPDVLLNRWLLDRHAFAWLPECIVGCGSVWIMAGFFGIVVKLCFWPKYQPDNEE